MIQAFRDNKKIFVELFRHAKGLYGESLPMPRIVNRQANRANPLAVSPLQFYRRSVFLPFIDTVLEQVSERFCSDLVDYIKLKFLITSVGAKHLLRLHQKCLELLSFLFWMTALRLWRLNSCNGVYIGYATKVILYRTIL